jgi:hypothetical protein
MQAVTVRNGLQQRDNLWYHRNVLYVPPTLRQTCIERNHDNPLSGRLSNGPLPQVDSFLLSHLGGAVVGP